MVMRMASREFQLRRADNVHDRTAHRSSRLLSPLINLLILSWPAAPRMLTWSPSTREKTGWLNSTMTYLNRQLLLVTHFVFWPSNGRILPALHYMDAWISSVEFPSWTEVKGLHPELRSLWHHRNNLSLDDNGIIWWKRSSLLQLLVPKSGREQLFLAYHASLFGSHLARLVHRFYWSGMSHDVKEWLTQCVACVKRKSPVGRHHPLGNVPTGHRWDCIAMDILDVCDPTPDGHCYILVIGDYCSKWTEAFPMKNKCADRVADLLIDNIILRFGMPLVIHSDQCREFENGLMKYVCALLGCTKTRTAPYHPESDGMIERFNRTCLMMLSMFVNDRQDNWHKLLPFVIHAYHTSVHESTGYSAFRLMMGEECSLPQDVSTAELGTSREHDVSPHPFIRQPRWLSGLMRSHVNSLWLLIDHCVLRNWDRILIRAVKGLIYRADMVSICPLLWQRDVKLKQTNKPHPFATWVRDALEVAYDHVRELLHRTAARRKRLYDTKTVNMKFPVGSWVLRYYPLAAQHKLGSPWIGPHQVIRLATGHTKTRKNLLCLFMWTIWNYARDPRTFHGFRMFLLLNLYALIRWISDRAPVWATRPLTPRWMCPVGRTWMIITRVQQ